MLLLPPVQRVTCASCSEFSNKLKGGPAKAKQQYQGDACLAQRGLVPRAALNVGPTWPGVYFAEQASGSYVERSCTPLSARHSQCPPSNKLGIVEQGAYGEVSTGTLERVESGKLAGPSGKEPTNGSAIKGNLLRVASDGDNGSRWSLFESLGWGDEGGLDNPSQRKGTMRKVLATGIPARQAVEGGERQLQELLRERQLEAAAALACQMKHVDQVVSSKSYRRLISLLCREKDFLLALQAFEELDGFQGLSLDADALSMLVQGAARSDDVDKAVAVLELMRKLEYRPRVATWSCVISTLGRKPETAQRALELWKTLRSWRISGRSLDIDTGAFNAIINASVVSDNLDLAESFLTELEAEGLEPDTRTYNILIKGYASSLDRSGVQSTIRRMEKKGCKMDASSVNTIVAAYVKLGDLAEAEKVVEDARGGSKGGVQKTARTVTTLMRGYVRVGKMEEAFGLLREMLNKQEGQLKGIQIESRSGTPPDDYTYATMVHGCVRAGDLDQARVLFTEMQEQGVVPPVSAYNSLLQGHARRGDAEGAFAVFDEMLRADLAPTVVTYNTLIDACVRAKDIPGARKTFQQMQRAGVAPSAASYTTLIKAFGRSTQPRLAAELFNKMVADPKVRVDLPAWNAMIDAYCRGGEVEQAEQAFDEMQRHGCQPTLGTYGCLIKAYSMTGQGGKALALWQQLRQREAETQAKPKSVVPDEMVCDCTVSACVQAGYFGRALEIIRYMEDRGMSTDKVKYRRQLDEYEARLRGERPAREDRRRRKAGSDVHPYLERFKFWLGMPNHYYERDWDWRS